MIGKELSAEEVKRIAEETRQAVNDAAYEASIATGMTLEAYAQLHEASRSAQRALLNATRGALHPLK